MTNQEIFDECVTHVLTQGEPAYDPETGTCMYETDDGLMCAIGGPMCKRGLYDSAIEGIGANSLLACKFEAQTTREGELLDRLKKMGFTDGSEESLKFLRRIQEAHDGAAGDMADAEFISRFKEMAYQVAMDYDLDPSAITRDDGPQGDRDDAPDATNQDTAP